MKKVLLKRKPYKKMLEESVHEDEALIHEHFEEAHEEALIEESIVDHLVSSLPFSFEDHDDDLSLNEDKSLLSLLLADKDQRYDDYWRSYGLPIYDTSRAGSADLEPLGSPCLSVVVHDHVQPSPCEESAYLNQQKMDFHEVLGQLGLPSPRESYEDIFSLFPPLLVLVLLQFWSSKGGLLLLT